MKASSGSKRNGSIRVVLVDSYPTCCAGFRQLMGTEGDISIVAEGRDGRQAIELAARHRPDVIVLETAMPGVDGIAAASEITRKSPEARVLFFSRVSSPDYVRQAVRAGAAGYLPKEAETDEVVRAVREVAAGRTYFAKEFAAEIGPIDQPLRRRGRGLTDRERQVMQHLAEGQTVREVAKLLKLSPKTVDHHKSNLMRKLDLHNRAELVRYAIRQKIVTV